MIPNLLVRLNILPVVRYHIFETALFIKSSIGIQADTSKTIIDNIPERFYVSIKTQSQRQK